MALWPEGSEENTVEEQNILIQSAGWELGDWGPVPVENTPHGCVGHYLAS